MTIEITIEELLRKQPEQFYMILGLFLLVVLLKYIIRNNELLKIIFRIDYEKRIQRLETTIKFLGGKYPELEDAINQEVDGLVFTNLTKYQCSKNRRSDFLRLYKFVKSDLNLELVKLLFLNSISFSNYWNRQR